MASTCDLILFCNPIDPLSKGMAKDGAVLVCVVKNSVGIGE